MSIHETNAPAPSGVDELMNALRSTRDAEKLQGETCKGELGRLLEIWGRRDPDDPVWRLSAAPYGYLGQRLLKLGAAPLAKEVAQTALGLKVGADSAIGDVELRLILGSALARTANPLESQVVLEELLRELNLDDQKSPDQPSPFLQQEILGILARTYKDQALSAGDEAQRHECWRKSFSLYDRAYQLTGGYWTGINVATLAQLSGERERAIEVAQAVYQQCDSERRAPSRLGSQETEDSYWVLATLGEAALVLGELARAEDYYRRAYALAPTEYGNLNSTRRHARWLLEYAGQDIALVDQWLPIPRVAVMLSTEIDDAENPWAPWPGDARSAMRRLLQEHEARIGFSSINCEADLVFQETLREMGGETNIALPYPEDDFRSDQIRISRDADWAMRFDKVLDYATRIVYNSSCPPDFATLAGDYSRQMLQGLAQLRAGELQTQAIVLTAEGQKFAAFSLADKAADRRLPKLVAERSPQPNCEEKILALLFADAVGFSKFTDREIPLFIREYLGRVAQAMERYGDAIPVRETWGDGLYVAFDSVRNAGVFSLKLLNLIKETDWRSLGFREPLCLRIALHAGPVHLSRDPITGLPKGVGAHVSRAARLEPKTPPGEIYVSEAFAALAALEDITEFTCEYVKQLAWAKHYGTFPTYVLRAQSGGRRRGVID